MKPLISSKRLLKSLAALSLATVAMAGSAAASTLGLPLFYTTGIDLGSAGWRYFNGTNYEVRNYAILTTNGGATITATNGNTLTTVLGDVGINSGNLSISGNASIRGHGLVRTGGALVRSGLAKLDPTGLTSSQADGSAATATLPTVALNTVDPYASYSDPRINQSYVDAFAASTAASLLPTSGTSLFSIPVTTAINQATSFSLTAPGQRVVLNLTDFVITSGATFDIYGNNNTSLVINVSNSFSLVGGKIILHGVLGGNVLFNVLGTGSAISLTSGARVGDTTTFGEGPNQQNAAIILAPDRAANISGGALVNGTLIARTVSISGNSRIIKPTWLSP